MCRVFFNATEAMTKHSKDWTGVGRGSVFKTLGASNHTDEEREAHDLYCTDPIAATLLCSVEQFVGDIWESSAGLGHLSEEFIKHGYTVYSTDLIDRGYDNNFVGTFDFLEWEDEPLAPNIITNPPYIHSVAFIEKAMKILPDGGKLCLFLKLQFLEGKARKLLFEKYPPRVIYVSSARILCAKNGDFEKMKKGGGSAVAYAWYCWKKNYTSDTIVKWL